MDTDADLHHLGPWMEGNPCTSDVVGSLGGSGEELVEMDAKAGGQALGVTVPLPCAGYGFYSFAMGV